LFAERRSPKLPLLGRADRASFGATALSSLSSRGIFSKNNNKILLDFSP
jgi:hypothetical protein